MRILRVVAVASLAAILWSCSDNPQSQIRDYNHYVADGYHGWITTYFMGLGYDEPTTDEFVYNENGYSFVDGKIPVEWRRDYFFTTEEQTEGKAAVTKEIPGEIILNGQFLDSDTGMTVYYFSGWVGKMPESGQGEHINEGGDSLEMFIESLKGEVNLPPNP